MLAGKLRAVPHKVGEIIKLIEADGWYLVAARGSHRQFQTSDEAGPGDSTRQAEPGVEPGVGAEHPEAGRSVEEEAAVTSYVILIGETPDGGFGAWAPDLPGCVALGDSHQECVSEMRAAVAFHLEGIRADGQPVPPASTRATTVEAA